MLLISFHFYLYSIVGLETSIIVGIVVGLVVAILLVIGVGCLYWRRQNQTRKYDLNEEANVREPQSQAQETGQNLPFYAPTTPNELKIFQDRPISTASSKRPVSSNSSKRLSRPLSTSQIRLSRPVSRPLSRPLSGSQSRPLSIPKTRRTKDGTESLL
jgi:hypothetical protein